MPLSGQDILFADAIDRLRAAAQHDLPIDAAQIHLINLQAIIRRAGSHWPLVKDKIRLGSMRFLKGCVAGDDIVIPAGDGFLIIFAHGRAPEMKQRAAELRALLMNYYLGQDAPLPDLQISVVPRQVEPGDIGALIAKPAKPQTRPGAPSCVFAPAWSPSARLIATYLCMPAYRQGDGYRFGYDPAYALTGRHEQRDFGHLDISMLDAVEQALSMIKTLEAQPMLGVSVHSTTMQHRAARVAFLDRLARLPPELMKHVAVKIGEIESGAPTINLADWAGMLRARVRVILLEYHHSETTPPDLTEVGVWGAGYQAPVVHSEAEATEQARQMRHWGDSLARQRKRFFLENARKPALVRAASDAGAAFISCEACWPCQSSPGGVQPANAPFPDAQKSLSSTPI